jgi:hypothetical protein
MGVATPKIVAPSRIERFFVHFGEDSTSSLGGLGADILEDQADFNLIFSRNFLKVR